MPPIRISSPDTRNAMEKEKEQLQVWPVWIDWENRILSFREEKNFEKREFSTHEEQFQFAVERTGEDFAIQ